MKRADGSKLRIITQFEEISDISPCYDPAYEDTTVALRSLQSLKEENIEPEVIEVKPIIEEPVIEPIIENASPVIDPVEWYRKQQKKY